MRALTKVGALALLGLLGASAALACAASAAEEKEDPPPEHLVPDAADDVAEASDDAGFDAGPCAASGLCTVPAPIDTRVGVMSISGSGATDVWAVGTNRTILHYDGTTWAKADAMEVDASPYTLRSVWVGSPDDVWITDGPALRHSTGWKGPSATAWESFVLDDVEAAIPSAISGKGGNVVIARKLFSLTGPRAPQLVTCTGWSDGGPAVTTYVESDLQLRPRTQGFWSIVTTRPDEVWATNVPVIDTGGQIPEDLRGNRVVRMYRGVGDPTWRLEEHDTRAARNLYAVWGNEEAVWLVGEGGVLRRMTRERVPTRVFEAVESPVTADLRGVYGIGTNDVWAVGDDATVVHWDGTAWTKLATPFDDAKDKPRLFSVWGSGPNDVWIGGHGIMLHYMGRGS